MNDVGVSCVQLGLDPLVRGVWRVEDVRAAFDAHGVEVASGMIGMQGEDYTSLATIRETGGVRPDRHWRANREAAARAARLARELGLELVTFHAGFLPHDAGDPERVKLVERLRELADLFAAEGVRLGLETGQETAATLAGVLAELDRANVGVNFDPANMILYGMGDPVEALRTLAPRVFQVHVKDAVAATAPGAWGAEVPVGTGEVDWPAFFGVLVEAGLSCDLMIEREAGDARVADMRTARELVLGLRGEVLR
ncbi:MAG: sugar phosphate isomerase/epimerase [Planctomycetes bacterium]|nr:sugar phosphate isomerase/epimerase [Planctomycetota bacterium]